MRRYYIKVGDKTTSGATVIEGMSGASHHGVPLSFIGAKIYCPTCKSDGVIMPQGPRRPDNWMGKQSALDNDFGMCACRPVPVLIASQNNMSMSFEVHELARMGFSATGGRLAGVSGVGNAAPLVRSAADTGGEADPSPTPQGSGAADCSYLDGSKGRIDAPAEFYAHDKPVSLSAGRPTQADFPSGGLTSATEYDATVGGKTVPIYVPTRTPADGAPMIGQTQLAEALEALPPRHLENIGRITTNASPNPDDIHWQQRYDDASFSSAATADIKQGVAFFPWKAWKGQSSIPQQYIDSTMLHETGHQMSEALWHEKPAMKLAYENAIAHDGQAPSRYAEQNINEDFAESANMYWSSKGTPCEAEGRRRYPARYRYFDSISQ
ncbi:PAAR repeat-containing protein [Caballeronia choica]|uniref:PAAR repeat-containing protein n=1 Tax=Caballeronia choica TaxID=326476 RepID=A0A158ICZ7_9BURK|nr:PAAR domain-containing protein [Caballeronia choica]SAL54482.1 PAAR repeat-containing protein [Caballeronia choica]